MAQAFTGQKSIMVAEALDIELANALSLSDVYCAPANVGDYAPGDLAKHETVDVYSLPPGIDAHRILYRTEDRSGDPVFATAFVLAPAGDGPIGGWPVIAWAHGTSGVARKCAPSAMKNLYYGELLTEIVQGGFAVVATDYHGLGTDGPHRYMDRTAQAADIIHSVSAARKAIPSLGRRWVAIGHSQGGLAVWTVAELQADIDDPGYLGAISVAPACHLPRLLRFPEEARGAGYYFAWHAYAIRVRYPEFDPASMLSDIGMRSYEDVTVRGCWHYGSATYDGVDDVAMLRPDWNSNEWVRKFYSECTAGYSAARGPILVVAGEADFEVPVAGIEETIARGRTSGQQIEFVSYPGLDHGQAIMDTIQDQLAWIMVLFAQSKDGLLAF